MKLLMISGSFPPVKCGVADYTSILVNKLAYDKEIFVTVLTDKTAKPVGLNESNVKVLPLISSWGFSAFFKILKVVREFNPDIIHIQYPTSMYGKKLFPSFLPCIFRMMKIPVVQTWHEPLSWKGLVRYFPNSITKDTLVVVEPNYKKSLPKIYNFFLKRKSFNYIPIASNIPTVSLTESERTKIRSQYDVPLNDNLIVYFGFVNHTKGIEKLFEICDFKNDYLVMICDLNCNDSYHEKILNVISKSDWKNKVLITGFKEVEEVARILAAADAVVFPFINGVGKRNGSFLAAKNQGTFVLTTHLNKRGYDPLDNVYYAPLENCVTEMATALRKYAGTRITNSGNNNDWNNVKDSHVGIYKTLLKIDK